MKAGASRAELLKDFSPQQLPATLATGIVLALVNALLSVALMNLIFAGDLSDALPLGIGVGLVASAAISLVIALAAGAIGPYVIALYSPGMLCC